LITVIDYNMGNIASIENILKKIGCKVTVTSDPAVLDKAEKIILPGVGSFDYGMKNLNSLGIYDVLKKKVRVEKTPILGICLGMQLLTEGSEEGTLPGLGFIKAHAIKFTPDWFTQGEKIPHMGWNYINYKEGVPLFKNSHEEMRFYFVHSYYVKCDNETDVLATTEYGKPFASVIGHENIYGVQFHPEKSHKYGMNLLKNYAELV